MARTPARKNVAPLANRKPAMLGAAAKLFARHGFDGTSMRMIANATKVRPASLYYHFPSKAGILVAIYQESSRQMIERVQAAINDESDPWKRFELACCAHVEALLSEFDFIHVVFGELPRRYKQDIRAKLVSERDRYEAVFRELIDALPMSRKINRKYMMLTVLGAMAWSRVWYRPGGDSPETIARNILEIVRSGVMPAMPRDRVPG